MTSNSTVSQEDPCRNIGLSVWVHESSYLSGKLSIKEYPPNSIIMATLAKVKAERDNHQANRIIAWLSNRYAQFYAQGCHDAWSDDDFDAWMAAKSAEVTADADLF